MPGRWSRRRPIRPRPPPLQRLPPASRAAQAGEAVRRDLPAPPARRTSPGAAAVRHGAAVARQHGPCVRRVVVSCVGSGRGVHGRSRDASGLLGNSRLLPGSEPRAGEGAGRVQRRHGGAITSSFGRGGDARCARCHPHCPSHTVPALAAAGCGPGWECPGEVCVRRQQAGKCSQQAHRATKWLLLYHARAPVRTACQRRLAPLLPPVAAALAHHHQPQPAPAGSLVAQLGAPGHHISPLLSLHRSFFCCCCCCQQLA